MNKDLIQRFYDVQLEARESENMGTVEGIPVVYNSRANLGLFDEVIDIGALDSTDLSDVRFCLNHDTSFVYARSRRNRPSSTMRLQVTQRGLEFAADLAIAESAKARDLFIAIKRKDIDKMSFMFSVDEETWENLESEHPTRHIVKIGNIIEISAVTFPAYQHTEINARNAQALDSARQALDSARQQRAAAVDTAEIDLAKAKFNFLLRR